MVDSFNEYFEENTQWVESGTAGPAAMPPAPPKSRKEMRRRREARKRKRVIVVIAAILVVVLAVVGCWFGYRKIMDLRAASMTEQNPIIQDYSGPGGDPVDFTVNQGEDAMTIGKHLKEADIVKSIEAFTSAVAANNATLYPGTFSLKKQMAASDVVTILSDMTQATGFLDVKAGERVSAVIANAADMTGIPESEFQAIIDGGGEGILPSEAGGKFEGWFEPGQYNVKALGDAKSILKAMVDARVSKLDELGVPSGEERERIINIASIAEAEVNLPEYYAKVTRVIENRIEQGMQLGMDSTVAYGNNVPPAKVTTAMTQDSSNPYNTYRQFGLPPTPISNPGDNAIKAAMAPESGDWLYFVTVNLDTGETKFTASAAEHDKNVAELRQWQAQNQ